MTDYVLIPVVYFKSDIIGTTFGDMQNYVNAEPQGKGIHEPYPPSLVKKTFNTLKNFYVLLRKKAVEQPRQIRAG